MKISDKDLSKELPKGTKATRMNWCLSSEDGSLPTASERLEHDTKNLTKYLGLMAFKGAILTPQLRRFCRKWAVDAAHLAFQLNPELREPGSLHRYFVAKAGRKHGLRGERLSIFVEEIYRIGVADTFIPEELLPTIEKWGANA